MHNKNDISFNFICDDKQVSQYPCTDIELSKVVLPAGKNPVAKIRTFTYKDQWHPDQYGMLNRRKAPLMQNKTHQHRSIVGLHAFEFRDKNDRVMLQAGFSGNRQTLVRDFILEPGERVLGVHSRIEKRYDKQAIHRDFQFIIGRQLSADPI
jgi:hypothetical protein